VHKVGSKEREIDHLSTRPFLVRPYSNALHKFFYKENYFRHNQDVFPRKEEKLKREMETLKLKV